MSENRIDVRMTTSESGIPVQSTSDKSIDISTSNTNAIPVQTVANKAIDFSSDSYVSLTESVKYIK
jgi:hypothetical protein